MRGCLFCICVCAFGVVLAGCETLDWSVVKQSDDRDLWSRCVEQRRCDNLAERARYGKLPEALTSMLHDALAASKPKPDLVAYLLQQGADPNSRYSGLPVATYLLRPSEGSPPPACKMAPCPEVPSQRGGSLRDEDTIIKVLDVLVRGGLDLKADFDAGFKSLVFLAVENRQTKVGLYLLANGARVESGRSKEQPIDRVWSTRNLTLLEALAKRGASVNRIFSYALEWVEALPLLCEHVDVHAALNNRNETPLYLAVTKGRNEAQRKTLAPCVLRLIERGADVNAQTSGYPHTPFTIFMRLRWYVSNLGLLKVFIERGAEVNTRTPDGRSALASSVGGNAEAAVDLLLRAGADPNTLDSRSVSVLYVATQNKNAKIARMLLDKGADPMWKTQDGRTALDWAVEVGDDELVALLARSVKASELKAARARAAQARKKAKVDKVLADARAAAARIEAAPAGAGGGGTDSWMPPGPRREKPATLPVVAVFDVELQGIGMSKDTRARLSELLAIQLIATGYFQVVPREDIKRRLTDVKTGTYKACYDETCQIELGKELAAEQTLAVKVIRIGNECTSSLTLFDLRKGTGVGAVTATSSCGESEITKTLRKLVDRLTY
ncbi:MAG: ankyrin repeat domain-containing protein [Deltaproteobacteria bacterium]|nr:ankyrin repeat domain-containing protein [Deltaproteobacteria bacterium]